MSGEMVGRKPRQTSWRRLGVVALLGLLAVNGVTWMQAWSMTHYVPVGQRTQGPEALPLTQRVWTVVGGVTAPRPENPHTPTDVGLAYETRRIEVDDGEFLEAWYVPHLEPRGIVLMFPGYIASKENVLGPAVALHEMGYDLLMVDFRGVGGSSGADTTLGMREGTDVALATEYAMRTWPGRPVILYGVSMGAAAVLRAVAVEGAQPAAIIIESPFDRLLSAVRNRFGAMGLPGFPGAELLVFWGSVQHGSNGFAHNPVEYARSVKCPVLVQTGEADPRATTENVRAVFDNLNGPKEFVTFPGAVHESLVANAPQLWKESVGQFLSAVGAQQ